MDLNAVQEAMVPGAQAVLSQNLSYREARDAFLLTLIDTAIKQCDGVQERAARKLGISPSMVNLAVNGKTLHVRLGKKKADPK